jgi:hypothetical protein
MRFLRVSEHFRNISYSIIRHQAHLLLLEKNAIQHLHFTNRQEYIQYITNHQCTVISAFRGQSILMGSTFLWKLQTILLCRRWCWSCQLTGLNGSWPTSKERGNLSNSGIHQTNSNITLSKTSSGKLCYNFNFFKTIKRYVFSLKGQLHEIFNLRIFSSINPI